jgi:hypothetical protein
MAVRRCHALGQATCRFGSLHADLADAIAAPDADKAGKASDLLIDYVESFARKTIDVIRPRL